MCGFVCAGVWLGGLWFGHRIWHSRIGDDGACALAEVLRLGGAEVQLEYLEVFDSGVGSRGCRALGVSLMVGANKSLQTLRLDYNDQVGSEGCVNIARGLRSNVSLKQLHLPYCDIGPSAGQPLGEALAFPQVQGPVQGAQEALAGSRFGCS